jgi:hypothetical protein
MLQHAVGKHLIERSVSKGQITAIRNHIMRLYPKVLRHLPRGADSFQRWVDSHRATAHPGRSNAPPSPVTSDFQKSLTPSRRKPGIRNRIINELAYHMDIQHAIRRCNDVLDKRIDVSQRRTRERCGTGSA